MSVLSPPSSVDRGGGLGPAAFAREDSTPAFLDMGGYPWKHAGNSSCDDFTLRPLDPEALQVIAAGRHMAHPMGASYPQTPAPTTSDKSITKAAITEKYRDDSMALSSPEVFSVSSLNSDTLPTSTPRRLSPDSQLPAPTSEPLTLEKANGHTAPYVKAMESSHHFVAENPRVAPPNGHPAPPKNYQPDIPNSVPGTNDVSWSQIQKLRVDVWGLRSQVHEIRTSLRWKQEIKSAAEDALLRRVMLQEQEGSLDQKWLLLQGQRTLKQLIQDCQEARDQYGPLEDECTKLEDRLSRQEFKLTRLEEKLYTPRLQVKKKPPVVKLEDYTFQAYPPHVPPSMSFHDDEIEESEYHPLVTQYLSKLGELDMLKERHDEQLDEREALEEEKQSRFLTGRDLEEEDQEWLDNFESDEQELLSEMKEVERQVESLRQDCLEKNLLDENNEPRSFQAQEQESFSKDQDIDSRGQCSEYVKYPLLIPHPGQKLESLETMDIKPNEKSDITTTRINQWILQQTRISPLQVNLMEGIFEKYFGTPDETWEFSVLTYWFEDSTLNNTSQFYANSSPPQHLGSSSISIHQPSDKRAFQILIASPRHLQTERSDSTELAVVTGKDLAPKLPLPATKD